MRHLRILNQGFILMMVRINGKIYRDKQIGEDEALRGDCRLCNDYIDVSELSFRAKREICNAYYLLQISRFSITAPFTVSFTIFSELTLMTKHLYLWAWVVRPEACFGILRL